MRRIGPPTPSPHSYFGNTALQTLNIQSTLKVYPARVTHKPAGGETNQIRVQLIRQPSNGVAARIDTMSDYGAVHCSCLEGLRVLPAS
ncbi:hypothetical protein BDR06DRAFT_959660 [Suillus hirtellus]|nr:hypothetical protein BDR06DRAFT_959660 [Suillus hirtellus]